MADQTIIIKGMAYHPNPAPINAGDRVRWHNQDGMAHTATADNGSWNTGHIPGGQFSEWIDKFQQPGPQPYHCTIHDGMTGEIQVGKA